MCPEPILCRIQVADHIKMADNIDVNAARGNLRNGVDTLTVLIVDFTPSGCFIYLD